ncbi:MAG TPA: hypothetical protein VIY27_11175, partial [Myxococcota bacterium]
ESVVHRWMLDPQNSDACRECVPFPPFVRVGCPTCGAQVGEPCLTRDGAASGSQTSSEPWASDVWATAHGERHGILSTVRGLEAVHDPEHCGWEPHPEHWGVAWLHGNDGPLGEIHASRRAERAKGDARKRTKAARDAQLGMKV